MCGAVASCRSGSSCRLELVRRGCAGRNPSRTPPRRFGRALEPLRRRPPLQRRSGLALGATIFALAPRSGAAPPSRRRSGLALEPPPPCDGAPTSLWSCASATAYRHRSGAASPATAFRPRPGGHDPRSGVAPRRCTPPLGTTTLALGATTLAGARPSLWHRAPGSGRFSRRDAATHAALGATTFALALCPPLWGPRPLPWAALRRSAPALGARDAKNRRFWSLAVKTDGFSRSRKWEMDDFAGCSRMGFPIAQIIVRFDLEAAKNRRLWPRLDKIDDSLQRELAARLG